MSQPANTHSLQHHSIPVEDFHPVLSDMMRLLQSSVEKEFQKVTSKLDNVIERIDGLEKSQTALEMKVQTGSCTPDASSTPTTSGTGKRKRLTPVALQVR